MKLMLVLVVAIAAFAAEQGQSTKSKSGEKSEAAQRAKSADAWVEKFSNDGWPKDVPSFSEIFASLERKYGKSRVPCSTFDAARESYFKDFVIPWAMRQGHSLEPLHEGFMKQTELPTVWTLTGRKRQGCV